MKIRFKLAALVALAATVPAFAQIKLNDTVSVTGWTVGSYQYTDTRGAGAYVFPYTVGTKVPTTAKIANASSDSFNVDAAFLGTTITPTKNVTGTFSLYYKPAAEGGINGTSEVTLLDANVAFDAGNGFTITAGKYLSPLGYESYYAISDNMITIANQQFLAPIPGYHDGIKVDYAFDKTTTAGVGFIDSLYSNNAAATEGDGHLEHNFGIEGYIQYTGIENLTLWAGAGYDTKGGPQNPDPATVLANPILFTTTTVKGHDVYVLDIWASYQVTKELTVAAEEIYKDGGSQLMPGQLFGDKGSNWLAYVQYQFSDKLASWFCFSGEDVSNVTINKVVYKGPRYWKASISPSYAITPNFTAKLQYSYTDYSNWTANHANYFGVQFGFKF